MKNPKLVSVKFPDIWKFVVLSIDLEFEHFEFMNNNWWWNEEMSLLIDPFLIMRKTDKDVFLKLSKEQPNILQLGSSIKPATLDLFKNWYATQT